jgi:formate dehydrogenase subunit gamma
MREAAAPRKILRFHRTERLVHWAIAIPFLVCYLTALIKIAVYHPDPYRPYGELVCWIHRGSGVCLIVLPILAVLRSTGDLRVHLNNIRQAWIWTLDDLRWLALMGLAAIRNKTKLPQQGKFNAAEKLNFMLLMTTYPLYILTGSTMWLSDGAFVSWIVHASMGVIATPLLAGHLFMAIINPSSRVGLEGMISGFVDQSWAKHHYGKWYREEFEEGATAGSHWSDDWHAHSPAPASPRQTAEFRRELVLQLLSGDRTAGELQELHGIEPSALEAWIEGFLEAGTLALESKLEDGDA